MVLCGLGGVADLGGERGGGRKVPKRVDAAERIGRVGDERLWRELPAGLERAEELAGALGTQARDPLLADRLV